MSGGVAGRAGPGSFEVLGGDGGVVLRLRLNEWETRFFERRIGVLEVSPAAFAALPPESRANAVLLAVAAADADGHRLVQAHVDVAAIEVTASLEDAGFRLVDTRVEFLTRLDRRTLPRHEAPFGTVTIAGIEDLPDLLTLAHEGLTRNPGFLSRYKNPDYFTPEETARWFAAWVEHGVGDPGSLTALWRVDGTPAAFFGYARRGERRGLPMYQSTLTVAAEAARGHKAQIFLQTPLFAAMPTDEFWVGQVTQLTNTPVYRNNFVLGRRLHRVSLTFFRRGPS